MKKKLFVLLIVLASLPNCSYAKSSGSITCEGLSSQYEDLDCFDASKTGAICDPGEDIISLPRKLQLCCCIRISDEEIGESFDVTEEEDVSGDDSFGFKKH